MMTPAALRAARLALGLTQKDLALRLHRSARQVRRWEQGVTPLGPRQQFTIILAFQQERQAQKGPGWPNSDGVVAR